MKITNLERLLPVLKTQISTPDATATDPLAVTDGDKSSILVTSSNGDYTMRLTGVGKQQVSPGSSITIDISSGELVVTKTSEPKKTDAKPDQVVGSRGCASPPNISR